MNTFHNNGIKKQKNNIFKLYSSKKEYIMHIVLNNKKYLLNETLYNEQQRSLYKITSSNDNIPYLLYVHKEQPNTNSLNKIKTILTTENLPILSPLLESTAKMNNETYNVSLCSYPSEGLFSSYIHTEQVSEKVKVDLFTELLTSVSKLHQHKILHNLIVPNNIFMQKNANNLALTLGLPHCYDNTPLEKHSIYDSNIYTNPHLLLDIQPSKSTDIYSLGVIGYHLFSLRFPYEGSTLNEFQSNYKEQSLISLYTLLYLDTQYATIIHNMILNPTDPYYTSINDILKDWTETKERVTNYSLPLKEFYDQLTICKKQPPTSEQYKLRRYYYQKILGYGIAIVTRDMCSFLHKCHASLPHSSIIKEKYDNLLQKRRQYSGFQNVEEWFSTVKSVYNLIQQENKKFDKLESLYQKINKNYSVIEITFEDLFKVSDELTLDLLGYLHRNGIGKPLDFEKAVHYYLESAKAGNYYAYTKIAHSYNIKHGKENKQHAIEYYKKAADFNEPHALHALANIYIKGFSYIGISKNIEKALDYYKRSAELGQEEANTTLALFYRKGKYVKKDYTQSYQHLLAAWRQGDTKATYMLGMYSVKGIGCTKNLKKAIYYYSKASQASHMYALCALGTYYAKGVGVLKNKEKARKYLTEAKKYGIRKASWELFLLPFR